jgi:hypothetical protein
MNNKQILEKAIQKAIDGGWQVSSDKGEDEYRVYEDVLGKLKIDNSDDREINAETIIFNHKFAKALWGDYESSGDPYAVRDRGGNIQLNVPNPLNKGWKHHLQQMVIADDPIKYLGENI